MAYQITGNLNICSAVCSGYQLIIFLLWQLVDLCALITAAIFLIKQLKHISITRVMQICFWQLGKWHPGKWCGRQSVTADGTTIVNVVIHARARPTTWEEYKPYSNHLHSLTSGAAPAHIFVFVVARLIYFLMVTCHPQTRYWLKSCGMVVS